MIRIGPIQLEFWHLILIFAGLGFLAWVIRGLTIKVSGAWERVDEGLAGGSERISLVQFGPFIRGRRMLKGGFQEYTGLLRGRTVFLTRRDHGRELIISQGFPAEIVAEIDGTVTAKLRLTLSADGHAIFGTFTPQKIEFTHRPPEITNRVYLEPSFRRYRLISRDIRDADTASKPGVQAKPRAPVRKTV